MQFLKMQKFKVTFFVPKKTETQLKKISRRQSGTNQLDLRSYLCMIKQILILIILFTVAS